MAGFTDWAERNIKKKQPLRFNIWMLLAIVLILIDEAIKENYIFKPSDVIRPLTHENLLTIIVIITIAFNALYKKFGGGESGEHDKLHEGED